MVTYPTFPRWRGRSRHRSARTAVRLDQARFELPTRSCVDGPVELTSVATCSPRPPDRRTPRHGSDMLVGTWPCAETSRSSDRDPCALRTTGGRARASGTDGTSAALARATPSRKAHSSCSIPATSGPDGVDHERIATRAYLYPCIPRLLTTLIPSMAAAHRKASAVPETPMRRRTLAPLERYSPTG